MIRAVGVVLVVIVTLALPAALVLRNVGEWVFSRDQLGRLVDKATVDPSLLARTIYQGAFAGVILQEKSRMQQMDLTGVRMGPSEADALARIAKEMLPQDLLDASMGRILDALFAWLDGAEAYPELVIDTAPFTRRMRATLPALVDTLLATLPACTDQQMREILQRKLVKKPGRMKPCVPPEPYKGVMRSAMIRNFSTGLAEIPPRVNVAARMKQEVGEGKALEAKCLLRALRNLAHAGWIIVLAVYLVSIPLMARSATDIVKWAGWPLLLAGAMTLLAAVGFLAFGEALPRGLIRNMGVEATHMGPFMGVISVLTSLLTEVGKLLMKQAGSLLVVGGVAVTGARMLARRRV